MVKTHGFSSQDPSPPLDLAPRGARGARRHRRRLHHTAAALGLAGARGELRAAEAAAADGRGTGEIRGRRSGV